jgi:hypothetical protein
MSPLRVAYLVLALVGTVLPGLHLVEHFSTQGWSILTLIDAWRVNPAGKAAAWDLLIAGITLTLWIVVETWVRRNWSALWAIPATLLIGVSCGLPLYLFLRTRPV